MKTQSSEAQVVKVPKSGPEVIKLFFMLNSDEHETFPAHKC